MKRFQSRREYFTFSEFVRTEKRYIQAPRARKFLETLYNTSGSRQMVLDKGRLLWRAQIGTEPLGDFPDPELEAPLPAERMKPLPGKAKEGRINPKGIPCLYLATCQKIAISEVRPWMEALVTIGNFKIVRAQKLIRFFDQVKIFSKDFHGSLRFTTERQVWSDVSTAFTRPVDQNDDTVEYIPTQVIAEFFKDKGFNGVAYRSVFSEEGMNIALFDLDAAKVINTSLRRVENIDITSIGPPFLYL